MEKCSLAEDSAKCRCSIPTSVQSASNPERITWPLCFPRRIFPRERMKERKREKERSRSSRRRAAARLERSHQRASPLFFPPRAAAFSGSRVDPWFRACNAPALFYRAPALITRHWGYYRGNAKRPSFWPLLQESMPLFSLFLRHSENAPNRNAPCDSILCAPRAPPR